MIGGFDFGMLDAAIFGAGAAGAWLLVRVATVGWARYRARYEQSMSSGLADAFVFLSASRLWMLSGLGCLVVWMLGLVLLDGWLPIALTVVIGLVGPRWLLRRLRARRLQRLREQLPDGLMLIAGALRAGSSLPQAIASMVQDMPAPISQEFDLVLREYRLGASIRTGLDAVARRHAVEELTLLGSAIAMASATGGNLAEALERLSLTLRQRLALEAKLDALTAQGRMQAWVMGAMPPALALVLHLTDPASMAPLFGTPMGLAVCVGVLVMDLVGMLWIRRLLAIRI